MFMAQRKENIVMFPFMAQGHIIPFLALALHLQNTNKFSITFVSTPLNIKKLLTSSSILSSPPQNTSPDIHFLEIPFNGIDHDLPPGTENTDSVSSYHLLLKLIETSLSFKPHFKKLINDLIDQQNGQKPLCIITDMFFGWCKEIAQEHGIFHAMFIAGGAFGFACYYSLWMNLPHRNTDSDEFALPDFPEAGTFHVTQLADYLRTANGRNSSSVIIQKLLLDWKVADGILVNTIEELDKIGLMYFRRTFGQPVWPVGPALLSTGSRGASDLCKNWLDTKPCNSVLYVAFGSQNTIGASQMLQLAMALEACGKNFIWVVRPPVGFDINSEFKANEWLPDGFEERIKASGKGLVVQRWAPQVEILSHKSVSAFLSHCGWNSVLEALSHGVPIIGWPLSAEQFYNCKMFEEENVGVLVEVARGKSSEVLKEEIVAKIELVMNETDQTGMEMRMKALEVQEMIQNAVKSDENCKGSSVEAIDEFLNAAFIMREGD